MKVVHATGHETRLKRLTPARFGSEEYAYEELVAELGAAMLVRSYGH
jgi:antirestriction protein ArdC